MRVKITLSYDGSRFLGFAPQSHKQTIFNTLEIALKSLQIDTKLRASGRTDKDVHATNQVCDFEIPRHFKDIETIKFYLNKKLPNSIKIKSIKKVDDNFHSRFYAKRRIYRYIISKYSNPFNESYVTHYPHDVDIKKMKKSISFFEGIHNFKNFKKNGSNNLNDKREIFKTKIYNYKEYTVFYFEANSFLRSQIRLMIGFLFKINEGLLNDKQLQEQLNSNQIYTRFLAPANGLYLSRIVY